MKTKKAILISVQPRHICNIFNYLKIAEIRKKCPKCDYPIDVYIYCTQGEESLQDGYNYNTNQRYWFLTKAWSPTEYNGKVVAKFTLKREPLECDLIYDEKYKDMFYPNYQLTRRELEKYVGKKHFFEWEINDLVIFDEPKELSEFYHWTDKTMNIYCNPEAKFLSSLTRAPQSWCYICVEA